MSQLANSAEALHRQMQGLVQKKKYHQALEKVQRLRAVAPDLAISPAEAEIYQLLGQQELDQGHFAAAEKSFRQALELGLHGPAAYGLAQTFLAQNQPALALEVMANAFAAKTLPKDYAGCYLKLLILQGDLAQVKALIADQASRFSAAALHWARGMLALNADQPTAALAHFQKMKQPATPGDSALVWRTYVQQQMGNWQQIAGLPGPGPHRGRAVSMAPHHPALEQLAIAQAVATEQPIRPQLELDQAPSPRQAAALALDLLRSVDQGRLDAAAAIMMTLPDPCPTLPEVDVLRRPLLLLGGQAAFQQNDLSNAIDFWQAIVNTPSFDPQLALWLTPLLDQQEAHSDRRHLLNRLAKWLQQEAQANPQAWPQGRLRPTLAQIYCWIADSYMATQQHKEGNRALREAEKLGPDLPDVIGRQGLRAYVNDRETEAIALMTRALEAGCQYGEVYAVLVECLDEQGDQAAVQDIRQRFGSQFGDIVVDQALNLPDWVESLSQRDFDLFADYATESEGDNPPLMACNIFVAAADDQPSANQRVGFNHAFARQRWNQLLKSLPPEQSIETLQAIGLLLLLFPKRQKGLAALQAEYLKQLTDLVHDHPAARMAHVIILAVKGEKPERLRPVLSDYLATTANPALALAQLQLQVRWFADTDSLRPWLQEALAKDSQNALLLLAQATTFPIRQPEYRALIDQGFDIARRVQDTEALKAYRQEEAFRAGLEARDFLPELARLSKFGSSSEDLMNLLEQMARQLLGADVSKEKLEAMLPAFAEEMGFAPIDSRDFANDDAAFFDFNSMDTDSGRRHQKKKKKSFFDL
ncbi:MAG: hypothetical protein ACFCVD_13560 [Nodosilinea sp.]